MGLTGYRYTPSNYSCINLCMTQASLGKAMVIDVGGGHGPVSIGLAQRFPDLSFIVQDLADVAASKPPIPDAIADHVTFMAYDLIHEQSVKDADIYFFRAIFHNWPDQYCVKILRNHIVALKPGARLIVNDSLLHQLGSLPPYLEKRRRYIYPREPTKTCYVYLLTRFGQ